MKNTYQEPLLEVIGVSSSDIITTSPGVEMDITDIGGGIWEKNGLTAEDL